MTENGFDWLTFKASLAAWWGPVEPVVHHWVATAGLSLFGIYILLKVLDSGGSSSRKKKGGRRSGRRR